MRDVAQLVLEAVHSVWREWSQRSQAFTNEDEVQSALRDRLNGRLPAGLAAKKPAGWSARRGGGLSTRHSAWRAYDIGVFPDSDWPVALLELAYCDTNVGHALHNGELKLLGDCNGIGVSTGESYGTERGLTPDDIAVLEGHLRRIPLRGLFFINAGPGAVLDRPEKAMWWETKATGFRGETRFWSALLVPERTATLQGVFQRLAQAGLHCWFYSLCGEGRLYLSPPSSGATGGGGRWG